MSHHNAKDKARINYNQRDARQQENAWTSILNDIKNNGYSAVELEANSPVMVSNKQKYAFEMK